MNDIELEMIEAGFKLVNGDWFSPEGKGPWSFNTARAEYVLRPECWYRNPHSLESVNAQGGRLCSSTGGSKLEWEARHERSFDY